MKLNQDDGIKNGIDQIKIDGMDFTIHPFTAIEALRLKSVIMKKIAPSIGHILGNIDTSNNNTSTDRIKIDGTMFANAIESFFSDLNEDDFLSLILRFLKNTVCIYKSPDSKMQVIELNSENGINTVFKGKIMSIYKLIFQVLKVNYPDFFVAMESIGNQLKTVIGDQLNEFQIK